MEKTITFAVFLFTIGFSACNNFKSQNEQTLKTDSTVAAPSSVQKNAITIAEIPVTDFPRAQKFYQNILNIKIEEFNMEGVQMGSFPAENGTVNVVLAKGTDYKPSAEGVTIYLNAGDDLKPVLDKVEANGGKIIVPKTIITPEMGYYALFIDTEGNKIGLHSNK